MSAPRISAHRGVMLAALLLVGLTIIAYRGSFAGVFVLDDEMSVTDNASIRRLSAIGSVLSPPATSPVGGRPIANLTFAINYALSGLRPWSYHLFNLAIHSGAALCLFGVVRRTLRSRGGKLAADALPLALITAALWALHPVQTATVSYIAQRTEELMGLFYLATLYAFIRGTETRASGWLWVAVATCALGMASKEVMVTAPVVVLLYDRGFVAGTFRAAWRARRGFYLGLAATWVVLALLLSGLNQRAVGFGLGVPWWRYALTESRAVLLYLKLAVWPDPLVFDYGPAFVKMVAAAVPTSVIVFALVGAAALTLWRRPQIGFLAAGFFLVLAPTSSVVPIATQPFAESRMYLPLAFVVSLGMIVVYMGLRRRGLVVAAGLGIAALLMTAARNRVLADPVALWRDTVTKRPANARAHSNYGAMLFERGQTDQAIVHEREAIKLDPTVARAQCNLAAALLKQGAFAEALEHADMAVRLAPTMTDANYQRGNALAQLGRFQEAIRCYEAEIRIRPEYPESYSNLGSVLYLLGRPAEAVPYFQRALELKPDDFNARNNLASAWSRLGRTAEAVEIYRGSLQLRPDDVSVRCNLGVVLAQAGRLDEAEKEFVTALQLQPTYQPAREELAKLQAARAPSSRPNR